MKYNKRSIASKTCEVCGKVYFPMVQSFERARYCSVWCKKHATTVETKQCVVCKVSFSPRRWEKNRVCCSATCARRLPRKHLHKHQQSEQAKQARRKSGSFAGENNGRWKGGRYKLSSNGHVWVRVGVGKYRPEHAVVAERKLGRLLKTGEIPHHVNMNPSDNSPVNIFVCANRSVHSKIHAEYGRILTESVGHEVLVAIAERIQNECLSV